MIYPTPPRQLLRCSPVFVSSQPRWCRASIDQNSMTRTLCYSPLLPVRTRSQVTSNSPSPIPASDRSDFSPSPPSSDSEMPPKRRVSMFAGRTQCRRHHAVKPKKSASSNVNTLAAQEYSRANMEKNVTKANANGEACTIMNPSTLTK